MPRVTRAALRSMEQQDESDIAASTPLPQTPIKGRIPLGDIAGNNGAESGTTNTSEEQAAPVKKGAGKGQKGNAAKKTKKQTREKAEVHVEVLEDENQSVHSSAAEQASQNLMNSPDTPQVVIDDRKQTPPHAAANTASAQLSPRATTPFFDSDIHKPEDAITPEGKDEKEDSFVAKIESRTPLKMMTMEGMKMPPNEESNDDSFVEQIKTRTPGRSISRIEDSVEALDALEEEIEKVGGLIPGSNDGLQSPAKAKKQAKSQRVFVDKKANRSARSKKSTFSPVVPATSNPSTRATNLKVRPSMSLTQQRPKATTQAPGSTHSLGQPTPQAALKQRISSVHKAPFQPHKSTKPPTRANFELPGDAFARKLKEQREERLKREEDEMPKPRVFKARPVRLSNAPEVKLTAATKARLSMAKGESINRARPSNGFGNSKPVARPSLMATASPNKRLSTLSVAKRSIPPTANGSAQPSTKRSARLTHGPSLNPSATVRAPSALGANRPAPTAEESAHQKLKGKEVFGRTKVEIMEREKAKKEKEDGARNARADAAERGRIASREWAEKQKVRKLEAGKANEQGKAVAA